MASRPDASDDRRDLIVLVADGTMRETIRTILSRHRALGIRPLEFLVVPHPEHDPGVCLRSQDFLRPFSTGYRHAMVMFDLEGSGRSESAEDLAAEVEERLAVVWGDACASIVLDPELERWFWSDSPEVDQVLGWQGREPDLRTWLVGQELLSPGEWKPDRPKKAVERALEAARKPRSAALYRRLAGSVSLRRCADQSFSRFRSVLQRWFPASTGHSTLWRG